MLHLMQAEEGYITPDGIAFCAEQLNITHAQVAAVATFYTMYKRKPTGEYLVSVCTNTLCGMLGGDEIYKTLSDTLGVGMNETTKDGSITLEHAECLAACDYAPVVTVNYEFFDNQSVESATELVAGLRKGERPLPTRGAPLCTFKEISRQIAGFVDERPAAYEAVSAGAPTVVGLRLAQERGEHAEAYPSCDRRRRATRPTPRPPATGRRDRRPAATTPRCRRPSPMRPTRPSPTPPRKRAPAHDVRNSVPRRLHVPLTPVLTKRFDTDQPWKIENYEALDGYAALRKALSMNPDDLITMVKDSGLRGRGGAGFPTGMKWQFIPQAKPGEAAKPHYVVVNADEGEPGTCRDLPLMMNDPHSMIEGIIIACYRGPRRPGVRLHPRRGRARHPPGHPGGHRGADARATWARTSWAAASTARSSSTAVPGAYICGEETALLDSLEGKRGQPRLKPPFPATNGLYDAPTVVNNVGTLASVPYIVLGGADWFKGQVADNPLTDDGKNPSAGSPGTCIYSLSGRIKNPGQYEAPMGTTLRELIDMAGGMSRGKALKFWTPGGSSTPMFSAAELDIPLDFDSAVKAGSMNGTSAVMIFDEDDSVVQAVLKWTEFYEHESCGKCTPCREGNYWTAQILERIWHGHGTMADLDALLDICDNILGRSFCALGDGATSPISSSLKYFRDEYLALVQDNPPTLVPGDPVAAPEPAMSLATSGAVK